MRISELDRNALKAHLSGRGLRFRTGPFSISLRSRVPAMVRHIERLYPHAETLDGDAFIDFHLAVDRVAGLRRWVKPQVVFSFDGYRPFKPLPLAQAAAAFEWGLNWCIASSSHQYLIIHAAVVEKEGSGLLLPGAPGSGKSTLCAALIHSGWRLFSDEMVLLSAADGRIHPVPRPVSLKNRSIEIIKEFTQQPVWGERIEGTAKGDIEHMRAPESSLLPPLTATRARYLVFPRYRSGCSAELSPLSKGRASMGLIENAFNFNILGYRGFEMVSDLVDSLACYDFTYPDLKQALDGIEQICSQKP